MGHRTDQLLPGGLPGGSALLPEVHGQDNDEDTAQELEEKEENTPRSAPLQLPPLSLQISGQVQGIFALWSPRTILGVHKSIWRLCSFPLYNINSLTSLPRRAH